MNIKSFIRELKHRNIYKVAVAYAITGWIIIQVATNVFPVLEMPEWTTKLVVLLVLIGFPIALVFAWAFEITPEGIQRTRDVPPEASISHETGRSLNYWIIGLLSVALLLLLAERIWWAGTYTDSKNAKNQSVQATEKRASVAVLPFNDFSPEEDQQWFSDGLTEEILNSLARLEELKVPARTSSFMFRDADIPIREIADSLGVNHVLEGSVRRFEDEMRITVQLIRAEDDSHLWSNTYKRSVNDVFKVQKDIATQVANTLDIYLDEEKRERMFTVGTRNVQAYEAYLKGSDIYHEAHSTWELDLLWKANKWFSRAYQLDSTFAHAYYQHSDPYIHALVGGMPSFDSLAPGALYKGLHTDLSKAIRHADNPGACLLYRFTKNMFSTDWSELPDIAKQISQSPDAFQIYTYRRPGWISGVMDIIGYATIAHTLDRRVVKRDPLHTTAKLHDAFRLLSLGKVDSALLRANEVRLPSFPTAKVAVVALAGNHKEARSILSESSISESLLPMRFRGWKLLYDQVQMTEAELDSLVARKDTVSHTVFSYFAGGYQEKANQLAHQIDASRYGFIKLWTLIFGLGGHHIPFDLEFTPNLARRFEEVGVKTEPDTLVDRPLQRIVQKETME